MANSMVKIDLHIIFHIKSTSVEMRQDDLPQIFAYIGGILKGEGSVPITVGGVSDHIHLLANLPKDKTISELLRVTKAKSSKWIKTLSPYYSKFAWQDGYGAFSVSPSLIDKTIDYIKNQDRHHQTKTFQEEYKAFLEAYKLPYDERYLFND